MDMLGSPGIPNNLKSYVCLEVFRGERPVLYVARPDGDWCFLCGDRHPDDSTAYRVVGIGHALAGDASLSDVLDLNENEEAERVAVGDTWQRRPIAYGGRASRSLMPLSAIMGGNGGIQC